MIKYNSNVWCMVFRTRWTWQQATFQFAAAIAALATIVAVTLKLTQRWLGTLLSSPLTDSSAYSTISFLIGIMLVFRTQQAYVRFWDGCSLVHQMMGDFFDGASTVMAFCRYSSAPEERVVAFQQTLIRLLSLNNAMVLAELEGDAVLSQGHDHQHFAFTYELLDAKSLDASSLKHLRQATQKPEVVFQWIQCLIVDNISCGVLSIPPPLLTRVFQDFGNALMRYHEARKYSTVPLPFPYIATAEVLLLIHTVLTPVIVVNSTSWAPWTGAVTFFSVFLVWSLHLVAGELENPFEADANDLDVGEMQQEMNERLVALVEPMTMQTPALVTEPLEAVRRVVDPYHKRSITRSAVAAVRSSNRWSWRGIFAGQIFRSLSSISSSSVTLRDARRTTTRGDSVQEREVSQEASLRTNGSEASSSQSGWSLSSSSRARRSKRLPRRAHRAQRHREFSENVDLMTLLQEGPGGDTEFSGVTAAVAPEQPTDVSVRETEPFELRPASPAPPASSESQGSPLPSSCCSGGFSEERAFGRMPLPAAVLGTGCNAVRRDLQALEQAHVRLPEGPRVVATECPVPFALSLEPHLSRPRAGSLPLEPRAATLPTSAVAQTMSRDSYSSGGLKPGLREAASAEGPPNSGNVGLVVAADKSRDISPSPPSPSVSIDSEGSIEGRPDVRLVDLYTGRFEPALSSPSRRAVPRKIFI